MSTIEVQGVSTTVHTEPQDLERRHALTAEQGRRFEQMLWAEMLRHAGLEDAFTSGGGDAASAFSRHLLEAIAEDLSEARPLGLAEAVAEESSNRAAARQEAIR